MYVLLFNPTSNQEAASFMENTLLLVRMAEESYGKASFLLLCLFGGR